MSRQNRVLYPYKAEDQTLNRSDSSFAFFLGAVSPHPQLKGVGEREGTVEECQLDENSMLIPIAVGGALAGLVLIVLLAYLIGRKRSHAGYQTI